MHACKYMCGLYAVCSYTNWMCVEGVQLVCVQVPVCGLYAICLYELDVCGRCAIDTCADYMRVAYVYDSHNLSCT